MHRVGVVCDRNLSFVEGLHSSMVDYYLGKWGGGVPKPFTYSSLQKERFSIYDSGGEADRKVPEQPLYFRDESGNISRYAKPLELRRSAVRH